MERCRFLLSQIFFKEVEIATSVLQSRGHIHKTYLRKFVKASNFNLVFRTNFTSKIAILLLIM
jgi:hypothetical protein